MCNHLTPLTLPFLYFGFCPQNPCEMTKNEMKVFHILLNICFLYYNICSFNLYNNQWLCTHCEEFLHTFPHEDMQLTKLIQGWNYYVIVF
jgi:hypothetical protein